jgi:hypothetical protein
MGPGKHRENTSLSERQRGSDETVRELREHVTQVRQLDVLREETVRSLRFTVTQLNQKNIDGVSTLQTFNVKLRALEGELDTQWQKHVELSDFARRAYIPAHAAHAG